MKLRLFYGITLILLLSAPVSAIDYRVERLEEAPPSGELSAEIAQRLDPQGIRVICGTKTTYCDIWFCKDVAVTADFQSSSEMLYPFHPGQIVGVARYARKGSDFRDQDIAKGIYTMRFALQPTDGAHEGTSITRDFLLLLRAEDDPSAADLDDVEALNDLSMEAAESSHPAMLALQPVPAGTSSLPTMRHDDGSDWWIVGTAAQAQTGDKSKNLRIDFVVVGAADE
ncbi:MAG: hypothetical protein ACC628_07250 [Pirellulaceae bacterium]